MIVEQFYQVSACYHSHDGSSLRLDIAGSTLVQSTFTSTDCTGTAKKTNNPLNKCVLAADGKAAQQWSTSKF
jgi:hypothetical protein